MLEIECVVEGTPTPKVTWMKDDAILVTQGNLFISSGPNGVARVRIDSVLMVYSGMYSCSASNLAGSVQQTFLVRVKGRAQAPRGSGGKKLLGEECIEAEGVVC